MKLIHHVQGSSDWLRWRQGGLGGSDAPAIIGVSPYTSKESLWKKRTGILQEESNFAMRRGTMLEPVARMLYTQLTGTIISPVCGEDETQSWWRGSFDGITFGEELIVEIKCPNVIVHGLAMAGKIPHYYFVQCQHLLALSGAQLCHFASYNVAKETPGDARLVIVEVKRDIAWMDWILAKEAEFWTNLRVGGAFADHSWSDNGKQPPWPPWPASVQILKSKKNT